MIDSKSTLVVLFFLLLIYFSLFPCFFLHQSHLSEFFVNSQVFVFRWKARTDTFFTIGVPIVIAH